MLIERSLHQREGTQPEKEWELTEQLPGIGSSLLFWPHRYRSRAFGLERSTFSPAPVSPFVGGGLHEFPSVRIFDHPRGMQLRLNLDQCPPADAKLPVLVVDVKPRPHRTPRDLFEHGAVEIFVLRGSAVDSGITLFVDPARPEDWMHKPVTPPPAFFIPFTILCPCRTHTLDARSQAPVGQNIAIP